MIPMASGVRVWLATGHTDMRRGMNSLALLVQEAFKRNPHGGDLYLFRGKSGKLIKMHVALRQAARARPVHLAVCHGRCRFDLTISDGVYARGNRLEESATHLATVVGRMSAG